MPTDNLIDAQRAPGGRRVPFGYVGQALMRSRLDRCDAEHAPAYLESTKQQTVPYYMRFGFEVIEEMKLPGGCPSMWPMWRAAR